MTVVRPPDISVRGVTIWKEFVAPKTQVTLVQRLRDVARQAPFFQPETRRGQKLSVRMTSAGRLGWISDRRGYRYEPKHPNGTPWPPIPEEILDIWSCVSGTDRLPDSCLINYYDASARMGLHQDRDEGDFSFPVVSLSLGDDALFRIGSTERGGSTTSLWLSSGDVVVMGGAARLIFHGVDRIRAGSSTLLDQPGRINVTLRAVTL